MAQQSSAISKPENKRILEEQSEDTQLSKTIRETHKEGLLGKKYRFRIIFVCFISIVMRNFCFSI